MPETITSPEDTSLASTAETVETPNTVETPVTPEVQESLKESLNSVTPPEATPSLETKKQETVSRRLGFLMGNLGNRIKEAGSRFVQNLREMPANALYAQKIEHTASSVQDAGVTLTQAQQKFRIAEEFWNLANKNSFDTSNLKTQEMKRAFLEYAHQREEYRKAKVTHDTAAAQLEEYKNRFASLNARLGATEKATV